jgi:hypothetical protein
MSPRDAFEQAPWMTKVIVAWLLSILIPMGAFVAVYGGNMRQIIVNTEVLNRHVNEFTPKMTEERAATKERVKVLEVEMVNIKEALNKIQANQDIIIVQNARIMNKMNKENP